MTEQKRIITTSLKQLLNKKVKILYQDGNIIRSLKGKLVSVDESFITLMFPNKAIILVKIEHVIKVNEISNYELGKVWK